MTKGLPPALPSELIEGILLYLPIDDPTSITSLIATRSVTDSFSAISQLDSIWTPHLSRWKVASQTGKREVGESAGKYYKRRATIDNLAREAIKELVQSVKKRNGLIGLLAQNGLDVVDYLERKSNADALTDPMDYLTVRYWSKEAMGVIMREEAVRIWEEIASQEVEAEDSFEKGVIAFTYFRGGLPGKMEKFFDHQARLCIVSATHTIEAVAREVMSKINEMGVKPAEGNDFHLLDNHFINLVVDRSLSPDPSPGTLPMTLVSIFCSIGRRLSLNLVVKPVGFPGRVLVAIMRRGSDSGWTYVDVFAQKVLNEDDLSVMRSTYGADLPRLLSVSSAMEMCPRVANNIQNSILDPNSSSVHDIASNYAASLASLSLGQSSNRSRFGFQADLNNINQAIDLHFPRDARMYSKFPPAFRAITARLVERSVENDSKEGDRMQARAGEWKSGDIFSHRLFNYVAIILGWDPKCSQSEEWIRGMGVDRLEFGRNQPFCHVIVEDGSKRYVAEENLIRESFLSNSTLVNLEAAVEFGQHFCRRDIHSSYRYVPSMELASRVTGSE